MNIPLRVLSAIFCTVLFCFSSLSFAQTKEESDKELRDLVHNSGMAFISAFVVSAELRRDAACSDYKDLPSFTAQEWVDSLQGPKSLREQMKDAFNEALKKHLSLLTSDGRRSSEVSIYLRVKDLHAKHLADSGNKSPTAICERLSSAARRHFTSSITLMNSAFELERTNKSKN